MKSLKINELVPNTTYYSVLPNDKHFIFAFNETPNEAESIHLLGSSNRYIKKGYFGRLEDGEIITLATNEQAIWLKECIKQNKFIRFENISLDSDDYTIF